MKISSLSNIEIIVKIEKKNQFAKQTNTNLNQFSNTMNEFNVEYWYRISLKNFCRFWRNVIAFNFETKKAKFFVNETDRISQCFRKRRMISISNVCRNIERKYEKYEFEMLLISSLILEKSNWVAKQTNVIFENFQKLKMIQILIWNCQYRKFCRKIDWFSNSIIETIIEIEKKNRFAKVDKWIFESNFEQIEWFLMSM